MYQFSLLGAGIHRLSLTSSDWTDYYVLPDSLRGSQSDTTWRKGDLAQTLRLLNPTSSASQAAVGARTLILPRNLAQRAEDKMLLGKPLDRAKKS